MLAILPLILSLAPEIARLLGGNQASSVTTAVANVVRTVTGKDDPQEAAAALAADPAKAAELRIELAKIAATAEATQRQLELDALKAQLAADAVARQAQLDAFKASIDDTKDARALLKSGAATASGAVWLSGIIIVAFGFIVWFILFKGTIDTTIAPLANVLLGTLAAMATQVANFWLGSSSGSRSKDTLLSDAQAKLAASVPQGLVQGAGSVSIVSGVAAAPRGDLSAEDLNALSLGRARS